MFISMNNKSTEFQNSLHWLNIIDLFAIFLFLIRPPMTGMEQRKQDDTLEGGHLRYLPRDINYFSLKILYSSCNYDRLMFNLFTIYLCDKILLTGLS